MTRQWGARNGVNKADIRTMALDGKFDDSEGSANQRLQVRELMGAAGSHLLRNGHSLLIRGHRHRDWARRRLQHACVH